MAEDPEVDNSVQREAIAQRERKADVDALRADFRAAVSRLEPAQQRETQVFSEKHSREQELLKQTVSPEWKDELLTRIDLVYGAAEQALERKHELESRFMSDHERYIEIGIGAAEISPAVLGRYIEERNEALEQYAQSIGSALLGVDLQVDASRQRHAGMEGVVEKLQAREFESLALLQSRLAEIDRNFLITPDGQTLARNRAMRNESGVPEFLQSIAFKAGDAIRSAYDEAFPSTAHLRNGPPDPVPEITVDPGTAALVAAAVAQQRAQVQSQSQHRYPDVNLENFQSEYSRNVDAPILQALPGAVIGHKVAELAWGETISGIPVDRMEKAAEIGEEIVKEVFLHLAVEGLAHVAGGVVRGVAAEIKATSHSADDIAEITARAGRNMENGAHPSGLVPGPPPPALTTYEQVDGMWRATGNELRSQPWPEAAVAKRQLKVNTIEIKNLPEPKTIYDVPREAVEMPWTGPVKRVSKSGKVTTNSELGYLRDKKIFWEAYKERWPDHLSAHNKKRIKDGLAPRVDDTWLAHHKGHTAYKGQTLEHHHVGESSRTIALPEKAHDAQTFWHQKRQVVNEGASVPEHDPAKLRQTAEEEVARHFRDGRLPEQTVPPGHEIPRASPLAAEDPAKLRRIDPEKK